MSEKFTENLGEHIDYTYSSFDRVVLRGYMLNMFMEGSIIALLRNLGFTSHSNGVLTHIAAKYL